MSADSVVVFYGAQITLSPEDVGACEARSHPIMKSARQALLDTYWADFIPEDAYGPELLVGRRWGIFGEEDSYEAHVQKGTVTRTMDEVDAFLLSVGLPSPGVLIVRFHQSV